jgi:hypothetical protein
MQVGRTPAMGPGESRAEAPRRVVLDEVVVNEGAQLERAQPAAPVDLAVGGCYFLPAFRVP